MAALKPGIILVVLAVANALSSPDLKGTFQLLQGPRECAGSIRISSVRDNTQQGTAEIDISNLRLGGSTCSGPGYVNMAKQNPGTGASSLSTTVRKKGGGGGGGGRPSGSGGPSRPSGSSSGSSSSRPSGSTSGSSRPLKPSPGKPVTRPGGSRPSIPSGTRLGSSGILGRNWLGAAFVAGAWRGGQGRKWKRRRKSIIDGGDDEFDDVSEALDWNGIEHYYGFHTVPELATSSNPDFTKWGFQCSRYGAEFRTRFVAFRLSTFRGGDLGDYEPGERYFLTQGTTYYGEFSPFKETPCIYAAGTGSISTTGTVFDCLPGDAQIRMKSGETKRADTLREGDTVHTGGEVFMFTHADAGKKAPFVRLTMEDGTSVELTPGHFLYVNGKLEETSRVQVGDKLKHADGHFVRVEHVSKVVKTGVYNPQTTQGNIVVNGFVVSTYTKAIQPIFAHSMLAPLRAIYRCFHTSSTLFYNGVPQFSQ